MSQDGSTPLRIPAAQYLRMSTERQEYSLDNQADAIKRYAEQQGFSIVQTYEDAGRSGLTINKRDGFEERVEVLAQQNPVLN